MCVCGLQPCVIRQLHYLHGGDTMDPQWVETIIVGWIAIVYRIMEYNREGGLIFVIGGLD